MVGAFADVPDTDLGGRLMAALAGGLRAGGEAGPVHSAGLIVVSDVPWPVTDLRVDWSGDPIVELTALWRLWRPQADAYRLRALDPAAAPSFAVPGDE
ncbi:MAG: major pilin protein fimA [Thermomicrobiales bacterium]|nr:major pilin protein fimA [Thermomicrobiales bacterium]